MLASSASPTQNLKGTWKNKHTVRKDYRIEFLVLWSNLSPVHAKNLVIKANSRDAGCCYLCSGVKGQKKLVRFQIIVKILNSELQPFTMYPSPAPLNLSFKSCQV